MTYKSIDFIVGLPDSDVTYDSFVRAVALTYIELKSNTENVQEYQTSIQQGKARFFPEISDKKFESDVFYMMHPELAEREKIVSSIPKKGIVISKYHLTKYISEKITLLFATNSMGQVSVKYRYANGVYVPISDEEIKRSIQDVAEKALDEYASICNDNAIEVECYQGYSLDIAKITESVFKAVLNESGQIVSVDELNADEMIINFENGLLNIETGEFSEHNPNVYSTIQIPCNYNLSCSTETPVFDSYLDTLADGDTETKRLLLEFMTAAISNIHGNRFKKSLFLVGDGNTGKSIFKRLLEKIIGEVNCASSSIQQLEERFGRCSLYGKRLVGDMDLSFATVKELSAFKQAVGGDSIQIEFKNQNPFNYVFGGLLLFGMNELPKFGGDKGDWVYDRIAIVRCKNVIPAEQRDKKLLDKLYGEREAIINKYLLPILQEWSADFDRLEFINPKASQIEIEKYKVENDTILKWLAECTTEAIEEPVTIKQAYDFYKAWCADCGYKYYTQDKTAFIKQICKKYGTTDRKGLEKIVHGKRFIRFFTVSNSDNT